MSAVLDEPRLHTAPTSGWQVLDHDVGAPAAVAQWDGLVRQARNGVFLYERGYMDYHADRFADASLTVWRGGELRAVLPAHRDGDTLVSHGGLSFGGLLLHPGSGAQEALDIFERLVDAMRDRGLARLVYKPVPHIFHRQPCEDDLYALHRLGARCVRMEAASTIDLERRPPLAKGRRHALSKARRAGLEVGSSDDYEGYWPLLTQVLAERHDVAPTHSVHEIRLLSSRFAQIRLFTARLPGERAPLAGAVIYEYDGVLHTQYLAMSNTGREVGALDAVIAHVLDTASDRARWLSFGISTIDQGRVLNAGLAAQKEMFGARTTVTQTLTLDIAA